MLIVLFDQMIPQYANQFDMPNFRELRNEGTNFRNAYLGYMASETVIAHNVITSGQLPKHMGWTDEAYRDADNLLGKGAGAMHITGDLSGADFGTLINASYNGAGYPKLADYLQTADPGSKFIVVGEKSYAVDSATAPNGAIGVRMSSRSSSSLFDSCRTTLGGRYRFPFGTNVPSYLSDYCGRWYINSDAGNSYGTTTAFPSWMYPEDGNRFFPGTDASAMAGHTGGDTWVADAAIEMMTREPWSGMFVTLGAIDKAAHMWGAQKDAATFMGACHTGDPVADGAAQTHVRCAAENADVQLGKMLDAVEALDAQRRRRNHGRADGRPRRHLRRALLRQGHRRRRRQQLVLRADRGVGRGLVHPCDRPALQPAVAEPAAVDRHGEHPVLLPVDRDRGVADQPLHLPRRSWAPRRC